VLGTELPERSGPDSAVTPELFKHKEVGFGNEVWNDGVGCDWGFALGVMLEWGRLAAARVIVRVKCVGPTLGLLGFARSSA
jgi:hypothetical protein